MLANRNIFKYDDFKYTKENIISDFLFNSDHRGWFFSKLEAMEYVDEYLKKFPAFERILNVMEKQGWEIHFTAQNLERRHGFNYEIYGITLYEQKKIFIYSHRLAVDYALAHEIAHFLDAYIGLPSRAKEWAEIKAAHIDINISSNYFTSQESDEAEYFANCFLLYVNEKELLKKCNNKAYLICKKLEDNMDKILNIIDSQNKTIEEEVCENYYTRQTYENCYAR